MLSKYFIPGSGDQAKTDVGPTEFTGVWGTTRSDDEETQGPERS